MLAENYQYVQTGRLSEDIQLPFTAKYELVAFIAGELPVWRDHKDRPENQSETALTEYLCDHLNSAVYYSETWSHVQFRTETKDETKAGRKIDLSVKPRAAAILIEGRRHTQFESLLPIECKRLPTPKEPKREEREYVITESGTTGGIQRFKLGLHGASHKFAAMIGYVQEESREYWLNQVNQWIIGLSAGADSIWSETETLAVGEESTTAGTGTYHSKHQRVENLGEIELRHLWVKMC